jgi:hypothetical protein
MCTIHLRLTKVSRVIFPKTYREKQNLAALVQNREPKVRDVIGFTDGVSIPVKCSSKLSLQATDYNGDHHDIMCNNVFITEAPYRAFSVTLLTMEPTLFHTAYHEKNSIHFSCKMKD